MKMILNNTSNMIQIQNNLQPKVILIICQSVIVIIIIIKKNVSTAIFHYTYLKYLSSVQLPQLIDNPIKYGLFCKRKMFFFKS